MSWKDACAGFLAILGCQAVVVSLFVPWFWIVALLLWGVVFIMLDEARKRQVSLHEELMRQRATVPLIDRNSKYVSRVRVAVIVLMYLCAGVTGNPLLVIPLLLIGAWLTPRGGY